jgi:hypothetical protein
MRYHWGLGVGHLHAHQAPSSADDITDTSRKVNAVTDNTELPSESEIKASICEEDMVIHDEGDCESDASELALKDRELEDWEDNTDSDGSEAKDILSDHCVSGSGEDSELDNDDDGDIYE